MKNYFLVTETTELAFKFVMRYTLTNDILLNHVGWERVNTRSIEPISHNVMDCFCIESEHCQVYGDIQRLLKFIAEHPEEEFEWYAPCCGGRVGVEFDEE